MLKFCTLLSGSSGNAVYCGTEEEGILLDCGVSGRQVLAAMAAKGLNPATLRAVLITHDHVDHTKGAGILSRKLNIPIYATAGTWRVMDRTVGAVADPNRVTIAADASFFLNSMEILPFTTPHDAAEPVGYRVFAREGSVAVATDLGHFSPAVRGSLEGVDVVLLESNHDIEMLNRNPCYPESLKKRILGNKGHLSNPSSGAAAVQLLAKGTRHFLLGHLSPDNNTPELARETVLNILLQSGAEENGDFTLRVAPRFAPSCSYLLGEE